LLALPAVIAVAVAARRALHSDRNRTEPRRVPPLSYVIFELSIYALAIYVLFRVVRLERYDAMLLIAAMVFTGFLELAEMNGSLSYYYNPFLINLGTAPITFPLCIAVAWGLITYSVMRSTARLYLPWLALAYVDALLAMAIDFVLDPIVASDKLVAQYGQWCGEGSFPNGSGAGIGLWIWCNPPGGAPLFFGIPAGNFFGWFAIVVCFTTLARVSEGALRPRVRPIPIQLLIAAGIGVLAYYATHYAIMGYGQLARAGVPQWAMIGACILSGLVALAFARGHRRHHGVEWLAMLFPILALTYCWGAYAFAGVAQRGDGWFLAAMIAISLTALALFFWVQLGGTPGATVAGVLARASRKHPRVPAEASEARIRAVDALEDGALRNLWITQTYHDLSKQLSSTIDARDANWSTFACWASKTAGESIRNAEVPELVMLALRAEASFQTLCTGVMEKLLGVHEAAAPDDIFDLARDAIATVSSQVAAGNLRVFAELAPVFASFVQTFGKDRAHEPAKYQAYAARFRPGPADRDGQDLLREAFGYYYEAKFATAETRAQKMLHANCLIGLHEQTRLQPNIAAALDAPIAALFGKRLQESAKRGVPDKLHGKVEEITARDSELVRCVERMWEQFATQALMQLALPGGAAIPLGMDPNDVLGMGYPKPLRALHDPKLVALAKRFGADGTRDTSAQDWSSLAQRMRFIIDLFRTTQQHAALFDQPFSDSHRERLVHTLAVPAASAPSVATPANAA
jgi:hypothetical protein